MPTVVKDSAGVEAAAEYHTRACFGGLLLDLANSMRMCLSLPEAWKCGVGDSMRCLTGCLRRREGGDLRVVLHLSAGGFGV